MTTRKRCPLPWEEVAKQAGTTRKSLQRWRREFRDTCPKTRDPAAWRRWVLENNKGRAAEAFTAEQLKKLAPKQAVRMNYREQREQLLCIRLERAINKSDAGLLVSAELVEPLGIATIVMHNTFAELPSRAAKSLVSQSDGYEIEDRLRGVVDGDLRYINEASYLKEDPIPEVMKSAVEEALRKTPGGVRKKNRAAFNALVEIVCRKVVLRVGEKMLAAAQAHGL